MKRLALDQHEDAEHRGRRRSRRPEPGWRHLFLSSPVAGSSSSRSRSGRPAPSIFNPNLPSPPNAALSGSLSQYDTLFPSGNEATLGSVRSPLPTRLVVGRSRHTTTRRSSSIPFNPDEDEEAVMAALQKLLKDPHADFRSEEQRTAVFAVLRGETPLVVVLPTGGGKTLLATLPPVLDPQGVTIFVAPFRALVNDMVQRFKHDGIDTFEWRHGESNPASIVVVSADFAADYGFLSYAQQMQQSGLLRRIFIDECHLTFTSSNWRPKLAKLRQLRAIRCPIILLTATLPPLQEFELETAMEIRTARICRGPTTRLHHRYVVQRCAPGKVLEEAVKV